MKLIKLSIDYYIIVDDSEIKEGDWVYQQNFEKTNNQIISIKTEFQSNVANDKNGSFTKRKITHSTCPIEYTQVDTILIDDGVYGWRYNKIKPLPLSEVKELIGEVDVEQYAWDNPVLSRKDVYTLFNEVFRDKTIEGAYRISASRQIYEFNTKLRELAKQKALEDNKDRKYTEEDLALAFRAGIEHGINPKKPNTTEYIKSLQPKTEWEVEYDEKGKLKLKQ